MAKRKVLLLFKTDLLLLIIFHIIFVMLVLQNSCFVVMKDGITKTQVDKCRFLLECCISVVMWAVNVIHI